MTHKATPFTPGYDGMTLSFDAQAIDAFKFGHELVWLVDWFVATGLRKELSISASLPFSAFALVRFSSIDVVYNLRKACKGSRPDMDVGSVAKLNLHPYIRKYVSVSEPSSLISLINSSDEVLWAGKSKLMLDNYSMAKEFWYARQSPRSSVTEFELEQAIDLLAYRFSESKGMKFTLRDPYHVYECGISGDGW